jgi:hypothetical protein
VKGTGILRILARAMQDEIDDAVENVSRSIQLFECFAGCAVGFHGFFASFLNSVKRGVSGFA